MEIVSINREFPRKLKNEKDNTYSIMLIAQSAKADSAIRRYLTAWPQSHELGHIIP